MGPYYFAFSPIFINFLKGFIGSDEYYRELSLFGILDLVIFESN